MKKILLVYDDYSELSATEIYLKKIGFDALGISNEYLVSEQIVIFNPDIIVANGKTQRVSSFSVCQRLKENHKYQGKVLIVLPKDYKPNPQDMIKMRLDAALESPVQPLRLIHALARLGNLDPVTFMDKFRKVSLSDPVLREKLRLIGYKPEAPSATSPTKEPESPDRQRVKKYEKFLNEKIDTHATTFSKLDLKGRHNDMVQDWDAKELERLDRLKREFAAALFKKKD